VKKILLLSAAILAMVHAAGAQMLPPTLGGTAIGPGYTAPGYTPPSYRAPGYGAPTPPAPAYTAPGYTWREQRANEDWRNNTWREQRTDGDWRTKSWQQQRANEDWRQREKNAKATTPNNAVDRGYVEPNKAANTATATKKNPTSMERQECREVSCPDYAKDKTKNTEPSTRY
jgi:hypothetical protein